VTALALRLRGVERRFRPSRRAARLGDGVQLRGVGPIDLDLEPAGRLALLGPSGCGKSTLLRVVAGFDRADRGSIEINGDAVDRIPLGRRDVSLVEQHLPLYEHLDGRDNVAMAISGLRLDRGERATRIDAALATAEASGLADRRAETMSGGERARVCLARVLARRPAVALLDEPFSGLDPDRRTRIRTLALDTLSNAGVAVLLVSHDDRDLTGIDQRMSLTETGHPQ
jgi:ABC-type sulfate/molybdate transport systems ATPase subunit